MYRENDTLINIARFCFGLNMFTTLPLELFVCREVNIILRFVDNTYDDQVDPVQVIEQFFFSHEAFNMQRHVFFTTVILVSALIGAQTCPHPAMKKN